MRASCAARSARSASVSRDLVSSKAPPPAEPLACGASGWACLEATGSRRQEAHMSKSGQTVQRKPPVFLEVLIILFFFGKSEFPVSFFNK